MERRAGPQTKEDIDDNEWHIDLRKDPPFQGAGWELFKPPNGIPSSITPTAMKVTDKGEVEFEYGPYKWEGSGKPYTYKVKFTSETEGVQTNLTRRTEREIFRKVPVTKEIGPGTGTKAKTGGGTSSQGKEREQEQDTPTVTGTKGKTGTGKNGGEKELEQEKEQEQKGNEKDEPTKGKGTGTGTGTGTGSREEAQAQILAESVTGTGGVVTGDLTKAKADTMSAAMSFAQTHMADSKAITDKASTVDKAFTGKDDKAFTGKDDKKFTG